MNCDWCLTAQAFVIWALGGTRWGEAVEWPATLENWHKAGHPTDSTSRATGERR
jgi:hypothetical protein